MDGLTLLHGGRPEAFCEDESLFLYFPVAAQGVPWASIGKTWQNSEALLWFPLFCFVLN